MRFVLQDAFAFVLAGSCLACELDTGDVPLRPTVDAGAMPDSGARDGGPKDASASGDAEDASPADGGGAVRHPSCDRALPQFLPEQPNVLLDVAGKPLFDSWRDVRCEDVADYPTCATYDGTSPWSCERCAGDASGLCTGAWDASWPCVPFALIGSSCISCVPPATKAAACCRGLEDVDCRAWPSDERAPRFAPCVEHADCEPGLVCRHLDPPGEWEERESLGFPVCTCPDDGESPFSCAWERS